MDACHCLPSVVAPNPLHTHTHTHTNSGCSLLSLLSLSPAELGPWATHKKGHRKLAGKKCCLSFRAEMQQQVGVG